MEAKSIITDYFSDIEETFVSIAPKLIRKVIYYSANAILIDKQQDFN